MKKLLYIGSSVLFAASLSAAPCTDDAVKATLNSWVNSVGSLNPVTAATTAYTDTATLMGTVARDSVASVAGREDYFKYFIGTNKKMGAEWNTMRIVNNPGSSIASGIYTFSITNAQGQVNNIEARYTFALEETANGCKITEHHSSAIPANAFVARVK
ncbi:MAG: hypothetical protein LBQ34_00600 [Alphaproteobacteria bacterium]|nr:hypothetical protein [Alphaproteobacteria bacterium]